MTAWLIEVWPATMTPSTGTLSPGRTRSRSPTRTSCAGTVRSAPSSRSRAVCGVRWTSFSMPARARATVSSSSSAPSCMIKATSPAAKYSPMQTEAMSAMDTRTSALMSKAVTSPMTASSMMGRPQRIIATQAMSKGKGCTPARLIRTAAPEMTSSVTSFFIPPSSSSPSSFSTSFFMTDLFSIR